MPMSDAMAAHEMLDAALEGTLETKAEGAEASAAEKDAGAPPESAAAAQPDAAPDAAQTPPADQGQEQPAPIAAKSGGYTIPYEKLTEARHQRDELRAQNEALRQQLAALQAAQSVQAAPAAQKQDAAPDGVVPADFAKAFGDFSEQGIAQGVKATVEGAMAKVLDWQRQQEQRQLQEQQARQQQAASAHMQAIYGAHPDADTVAESREFQAWVDAQPVYARAGIAQALQAGSAQDVVAVLDAFKQAGLPAGAPAAKAAPQPAAAKADVQAAAAPPVSLSALPGSAPAASDAERVAQLAASDPVALMDFMSNLSSEKRAQLMNSLV
nr:MAG TPA: hypothetical protein [Caudoviricetes sp.]